MKHEQLQICRITHFSTEQMLFFDVLTLATVLFIFTVANDVEDFLNCETARANK